MAKREFQSPGCDFGLGLRVLVLALRLFLLTVWRMEARDVAAVESEVWLFERELILLV